MLQMRLTHNTQPAAQVTQLYCPTQSRITPIHHQIQQPTLWHCNTQSSNLNKWPFIWFSSLNPSDVHITTQQIRLHQYLASRGVPHHHHHHQDHSCWTSLHRSQPQFQTPIGTDSVGEPYSNCNLQSCAHTNQCPHLPTPCLFQHSRDYRCTRRDPALLPPAVTPCHALCVWAAVAAPGPRPAAEPGTGPRTAAGSGTHWPGTAR